MGALGLWRKSTNSAPAHRRFGFGFAFDFAFGAAFGFGGFMGFGHALCLSLSSRRTALLAPSGASSPCATHRTHSSVETLYETTWVQLGCIQQFTPMLFKFGHGVSFPIATLFL